jgi:hypothetical protein
MKTKNQEEENKKYNFKKVRDLYKKIKQKS